MASLKRQVLGLAINGGYNTEAGPHAGFRVTDDGFVSVPWLMRAQNVIYSLDGWPRKMPGASRVNSITTGASDAMMGIFDYWKSTTSGDPVQKRVAYSGDEIFKEDLDGTWDSLKGSLETGKMPSFEVMNDNLVMASTSIVDVPQLYNQTTIANLGGSPPNFAIHCQHKDRMWAAGVDSAKSRLYYTVSANEGDWVGLGSGSIDISPDDGDVITGIVSHKDELIIFKGPNKGSIWRLTGSSPTGTDAFVLHIFIRGIGATSHQGIIRTRDDLWFPDDLGLHSLVATASYGDYAEAFLSKDIATFWNAGLNHSRFRYIWGQNFVTAGYALWTIAQAGSTNNNIVLLMDYRFSPVRFATWPAASVASIAMVKDTSGQPTPWFGTYSGYALRGNRAARNWEGSAYTHLVQWPYLSFGDPFINKQITRGRIGYAPKGDFTFGIRFQRDGQTEQSVSISQGGTATLAPSSNQFTLDSSTLGGGRHLNQFFDVDGMFQEIQFTMQQTDLDVDFEPHSLALEVEPCGMGTAPIPG